MPKARATVAKKTPATPPVVESPPAGLLYSLMKLGDLAAWDMGERDRMVVNAVYARMSEHDRREIVRIVDEMSVRSREK